MIAFANAGGTDNKIEGEFTETGPEPLLEKIIPLTPPRMNFGEAMQLNRHERRRLGKINGVKIPGLKN